MKATHLIVRAFLLTDIDNILNEDVVQDAYLIVSEARKQAGGKYGQSMSMERI